MQQERIDYVISEVTNLQPAISIQENRGGTSVSLNGFNFDLPLVEDMIQQYRNVQEDLMNEGASDSETAKRLSETKLGMISSEDWQKIADGKGDALRQTDLIASEDDKLFITSSISSLVSTLQEESEVLRHTHNRRLRKGKILYHLFEKLKSIGFKGAQEFVRSEVDNLGLQYAGSLSPTEMSIVTKTYKVYFHDFNEDIDVEIEDVQVSLPDSDIPNKFAISEVAVNNLYALADLVDNKDARNRLASFAYRNTEDACKRLKRASKTNAKLNQNDVAEIHEPLPVSGTELLDFFDKQEDAESAFGALANQAEQVKSDTDLEERKSELVNIAVPRIMLELIYNGGSDEGIKDIIDRNYPRKDDVDIKTGIRCSVSDILWLLWRLPEKLAEMPLQLKGQKVSPTEIIEIAFAEMRKEDELDGSR